MDALQVYASDSDPEGEDADDCSPKACAQPVKAELPQLKEVPLPSPDELLRAFPSGGQLATREDTLGGRVRSFPHVKGNYALHVYIPVPLSSAVRGKLEPFLKRAFAVVPALQPMEGDMIGAGSAKASGDVQGFRLGTECHISLGRTVPIRVHQIDTVVQMLRHKLASQRGYWVEYGMWKAFINDERTRSFLAIEVVSGGSSEIKRQVLLVDEVYKRHNLPTFYKDPRPHISLAWVAGDEMERLSTLAVELNKLAGLKGQPGGCCLWTSPVTRIECKIGQKLYPLWLFSSGGSVES